MIKSIFFCPIFTKKFSAGIKFFGDFADIKYDATGADLLRKKRISQNKVKEEKRECGIPDRKQRIGGQAPDRGKLKGLYKNLRWKFLIVFFD